MELYLVILQTIHLFNCKLKRRCNVTVQIVSLNGQLIQTINKGNLSQGTYNIPLNLTNAPHGIYIVRLLVDKNSYTKKIIK